VKFLILAPYESDSRFGQNEALYGELSMYSVQYSWKLIFETLGHVALTAPSNVIDSLLYKKLDRFKEYLFKINQKKDFLFKKINQYNDNILYLMKDCDALIVTGGFSLIKAETLIKIKKSNKILIYINGMPPFLWLTENEKNSLMYYDLVLINDPTHIKCWEMLNCKNVVALPMSSYDSRIVNCKNKKIYTYEISFIGSLAHHTYANRVDILKYLIKNQINISIWSPDSEYIYEHEDLLKHYMGKIGRSDIAKVYSESKIVLNIHAISMPGGGNMTTFEALGSGAFMLIDNFMPAWLKEEKEVVKYNNKEDLLFKITYYLDQDKKREEIAENGYKRVLKDHTIMKRFEQILELMRTLKTES